MEATIESLRQSLLNHPLYAVVNTPSALRTFTEHHVVCVWDFMSLLKSLQRELTGWSLPWTPPGDPESCRFINEIVLGEESDQVDEEPPRSHFEWYLDAMSELGSDRAPILRLIAALQGGTDIPLAISESELPSPGVAFIRSTLAVLDQPLHIRAAVFFHAREDLIPGMFLQIVDRLRDRGVACGGLLSYLRRHIEVDADHHGPLAEKLLERLFAGDPAKQQAALVASVAALNDRLQLWNAIEQRIRSNGNNQ